MPTRLHWNLAALLAASLGSSCHAPYRENEYHLDQSMTCGLEFETRTQPRWQRVYTDAAFRELPPGALRFLHRACVPPLTAGPDDAPLACAPLVAAVVPADQHDCQTACEFNLRANRDRARYEAAAHALTEAASRIRPADTETGTDAPPADARTLWTRAGIAPLPEDLDLERLPVVSHPPASGDVLGGVRVGGLRLRGTFVGRTQSFVLSPESDRHCGLSWTVEPEPIVGPREPCNTPPARAQEMAWLRRLESWKRAQLTSRERHMAEEHACGETGVMPMAGFESRCAEANAARPEPERAVCTHVCMVSARESYAALRTNRVASLLQSLYEQVAAQPECYAPLAAAAQGEPHAAEALWSCLTLATEPFPTPSRFEVTGVLCPDSGCAPPWQPARDIGRVRLTRVVWRDDGTYGLPPLELEVNEQGEPCDADIPMVHVRGS